MSFTVGSTFSGIGGFDLAYHRAGGRSAFLCEIDPACQKVLARQFPGVPCYPDVREVRGDAVGPVDALVGGFPCQDLSVAGKRKGLAGERSGLFHEFARLASELAPRWVVLENVPGLLSSNGGRDMGTVLRTLGELGYGWAYRCLDAQHFGLAQRRLRVFIVGCLGDSARAAQVLFEPQSGEGDPPPSREAGQRVAGTLAGGAHPSGFNGQDADRGNLITATLSSSGDSHKGFRHDEGIVVACLTANYGKQFDNNEGGGVPFVAHTLTANYGKNGGIAGGKTPGPINLVAHTLRAEGADASEDGTGRGTPLVTCFQQNQRNEVRTAGRTDRRIARATGN